MKSFSLLYQWLINLSIWCVYFYKCFLCYQMFSNIFFNMYLFLYIYKKNLGFILLLKSTLIQERVYGVETLLDSVWGNYCACERALRDWADRKAVFLVPGGRNHRMPYCLCVKHKPCGIQTWGTHLFIMSHIYNQLSPHRHKPWQRSTAYKTSVYLDCNAGNYIKTNFYNNNNHNFDDNY